MIRSKKHDVFTEEVMKIAFVSNDDQRIQSINLIEIYAYGTSKDIVWKKEEIQCKYKIKHSKNN